MVGDAITDTISSEQRSDDKNQGEFITSNNCSSTCDNLRDDEGDDDDNVILSAKKIQRRKVRAVIASSDEEDAEDNSASPDVSAVISLDTFDASDEECNSDNRKSDPSRFREHQTESESNSNCLFLEDSDDENISNDAVTEKSSKPAVNDDLFDAEMEEEDNRSVGANDDNDNDQSGRSDEDVHISDELRKKLAKGASKKPKQQRKAAVAARKQSLKEIHSETQRLVRESAVQLPYHQPKPADLSVFLERTRQKQQQLSQGSKNQKLPWKAAPIQHASSSKPSISHKDSAAMAVDKIDVSVSATCKQAGSDTDSAAGSESLIAQPNDSAQAEDKSDYDKRTDLVINDNRSDEDDVVMLSSSVAEKYVPEIHLFIGPDGNTAEESEDLTCGQTDNCVNQVCNSPDRTDVSADSADKATHLTPNLKQLQVKPTLGGGCASDIINLDEVDDDNEENPTDHPGLDTLLTRLVQHNKAKPKKSRDMTINTVVKDRADDGQKEELRLESMTYHVEEEAKPTDPKLNKPGAKLAALKEHLQSHMRVRRHAAREERLRVYQLDNEEAGYEATRLEEDPLDNEAELTDQTDTDGEEEDEGEEGWGLYGGKQKVKDYNPYVEEEADEDDDDDYDPEDDNGNDDDDDINEKVNDDDDCSVADDEDYDDEDDEEGLHLELDNGGGQADSEEEGCQKANDSDGVIRMAKNKSVDLFSENAFSESPAGSQTSSQDTPELSERPFEKLSGETVILADNDDDMGSGQRNSLKCASNEETNTSLTSIAKDSSFGGDSDLLPAGQEMSANRLLFNHSMTSEGRSTPDLFSPSTKSAQSKIQEKQSSELFLPIEDTQDLLNSSSLSMQSELTTPKVPSSQSGFTFTGLGDDTQSLVLDADGLFKSSSRSDLTEKTRNQLLGSSVGLASEDSSNVDELLGLCSGRFTQAGTQSVHAPLPASSQDMNELLGLCSGKFTATQACNNSDDEQEIAADKDSPVKSGRNSRKKKRRVIRDDDDDDELQDSDDSFIVADADVEDHQSNQENLDSDEDPCEEKCQVDVLTFRDKSGKLRRDFVEEEAELSGSEVGSDEDDDEDEEEDVLETEAGDADDVGSQQHLHDQVNRIHLKKMIDSDKRDIRLLQEMYLPDGDMHSDRARTRRFRWANVDEDDTQQDMFHSWDADDAAAVDEEMGEAEKQWRLERHERELFLAQNQEETEKEAQIKLGNVVFKTQSTNRMKPNKETNEASQNDKDTQATKHKVTNPKTRTQSKENTLKSPSLFKVPKLGSFLGKGKDSLAKIAEMTKPASANLSGPKSSGKFVFTAMSPDSSRDNKPQVKRSLSVDSASQPASKRPRVLRSNTLPPKSIFHLLEKTNAS